MIPQKQHIVFKQLLFEFLLLNLCIMGVLIVKNPEDFDSVSSMFLSWEFSNLCLIFNSVWTGIILLNRDQDFYLTDQVSEKVKNILLNAFIFVGVLSSMAVLFKIEYFNRTTFYLPVFLFALFDLIFFSTFFEYYKRNHQKQTGLRSLLIGIGDQQKHLIHFCDSIRQANYQIQGYLDRSPHKQLPGLEWKGDIQNLSEILTENQVDEIFLTLSALKPSEIKQTIKTADYHGVRVSLIPEASVYVSSNFKSYSLNGIPCFKYRQSPLDQVNNFIFKKVFDILFALAVLLILSPIYLLIAIIIYLDSSGPILYTPLRKGEGGKIFKCYKFRTMTVCDNPVNGQKSTIKNDPRITRAGKYLRKLDLDELPQFFNVLRGEMSVVGPRPHRVNLKHDFRKIVNDYMVRHYVKPGITGWAQVNGWRGPTETTIQKKSRIQHDLWYIEHWRFLLDIKIIWLTVFGKKTRQNAF